MAKDTQKQPEDNTKSTTPKQGDKNIATASKAPAPENIVPFEKSKATEQEAAKLDSEKLERVDTSPEKTAISSDKSILKKDIKASAPLSNRSTDAKKVKDDKSAEKTAKIGTKEHSKPIVSEENKNKLPEKAPPIEEGSTLAERKEKLEKELREKFSIPKSAKIVAAWVAPEVEQVVRIPHKELHSFKDHPFNVDKNAKYKAFVVSIRAQGVTQPAIIRPREAGGYEIISGHRRDEGSKDAGIPFTPCIIRALNDDQAIQQMVEDNVNNREIGTMELARALNMQLESIKHQGAQDSLNKDEPISADDVNKRSNTIIAERNGMSVKQVQRHINLTRLVPALQELVDGKPFAFGDKTKVLKIGFTPAVELSAIKQKELQEYIAVAIEGQQAAPSLSQAQRMRKMADQNILKPDMIDGIMTEEKKEVDRVIISTEELAQFFGKDKTPREMKETIITLLDEWKGKQKDISTPQRKNEHEK